MRRTPAERELDAANLVDTATDQLDAGNPSRAQILAACAQTAALLAISARLESLEAAVSELARR